MTRNVASMGEVRNNLEILVEKPNLKWALGRHRRRWEDDTLGSRFTTGLRSRIFGCKSNRRKTSTI